MAILRLDCGMRVRILPRFRLDSNIENEIELISLSKKVKKSENCSACTFTHYLDTVENLQHIPLRNYIYVEK